MTIPQGWQVHGELPSVEFDAASGPAREVFDEDILQVADASGTYTIDVGWYPAQSPKGQFVGKVILGDRWDVPEETFETRSLVAVKDWLSSAVEYVRGMVGNPDQIP